MSIISGITCKNGTSLVLTAPTTVDLSVVNIYNTGGSNVTIDGNLTVPGTATIGTLAFTNLTVSGALSAGSAQINGNAVITGNISTNGHINNGLYNLAPLAYGTVLSGPSVVGYNVTSVSEPSTGQYIITLNISGTSGFLMGIALMNGGSFANFGPVFYQAAAVIGNPCTISFGSNYSTNVNPTNYPFNFVVYGYIT
jgi:hypothetical protein